MPRKDVTDFCIAVSNMAQDEGLSPAEFGSCLAVLLASLCVSDFDSVEEAAPLVGRWFETEFAHAFAELKARQRAGRPTFTH